MLFAVGLNHFCLICCLKLFCCLLVSSALQIFFFGACCWRQLGSGRSRSPIAAVVQRLIDRWLSFRFRCQLEAILVFRLLRFDWSNIIG